MRDKLFTLFLLFAIAIHTGDSSKITLVVSVYLGLKIRRLVILTIRMRNSAPEVYFVISPGQAIADATAQTFRCLTFAAEACLVLMYSRFLANLCPTQARRNVLSLYTIIFALLHCWEYVLQGIYRNVSTRRS